MQRSAKLAMYRSPQTFFLALFALFALVAVAPLLLAREAWAQVPAAPAGLVAPAPAQALADVLARACS